MCDRLDDRMMRLRWYPPTLAQGRCATLFFPSCRKPRRKASGAAIGAGNDAHMRALFFCSGRSGAMRTACLFSRDQGSLTSLAPDMLLSSCPHRVIVSAYHRIPSQQRRGASFFLRCCGVLWSSHCRHAGRLVADRQSGHYACPAARRAQFRPDTPTLPRPSPATDQCRTA